MRLSHGQCVRFGSPVKQSDYVGITGKESYTQDMVHFLSQTFAQQHYEGVTVLCNDNIVIPVREICKMSTISSQYIV